MEVDCNIIFDFVWYELLIGLEFIDGEFLIFFLIILIIKCFMELFFREKEEKLNEERSVWMRIW